MLKKLSPITLLFFSFSTPALTLMEINTEWLWDCKAPHEGRIIGETRPAPTCQEYREELEFYASLIKTNNAEAVALAEIENCNVAKEMATTIGPVWQSVCLKSRDTFTGQDVALLLNTSVFKPVPNTETTHPEHYAMIGSKKVRPSKVLSAVARHQVTKELYLFTTVHLISKTRSSNEAKRHAQALAVKSGMESISNNYPVSHTVLMGDMNDYPGSQTLLNLKGDDLINPADQNDCSYIYRGKCNLIDHILVSKSLSGGELTNLDMPEKYSDHKAVIYSLQ
ncbi:MULTISPECIES: endonuclease/exonuclease/phosphatase family protein [unclassified Endozoicomonas]|uniref:endonuclease/exonuclease/phosphatase family protein n=1 Tax=unclassified Endozoicomonas TaxID=2644528 RepID=UPI003BB768B0